jgi:hypothetical protein
MSTLADTVGDAAAIRDELRALVGYSTDTVLCPDALCDAAIRRALDTLNGLRPAIGLGYFSTVADQQAYTPLPAGAYRIRQAWWPNDTTCPEVTQLTDSLAPYFGEPIDEFGTYTTLEPAAVEAFVRVQSYLRRRLYGRAYVTEESSVWTVRLDPVPSSAGDTVFFSYSTPRYASAGVVTTQDAERFWTAAEMHMHKALSAGAGGVTDVEDPTEGVRISTRAPVNHLELYRDARVRLNRMAPPPTFMGL